MTQVPNLRPPEPPLVEAVEALGGRQPGAQKPMTVTTRNRTMRTASATSLTPLIADPAPRRIEPVGGEVIGGTEEHPEELVPEEEREPDEPRLTRA